MQIGGRSRGYIFTNKKQSTFGIMSTFFGSLSSVTLIVLLVKSYKAAGNNPDRFGVTAALAIMFCLIGMGLGIYSLTETDRFKLFRILGIVTNTLTLLLLSVILFAGAYIN